MTSSFLIAYPDVPASALVVTPNVTYDTLYPVENTFYGDRHAYGQQGSANSALNIIYDLGTGNTRTIDHLILAGVGPLLADSVAGVKVQGSNNGSSWTDLLGTGTLSSCTFHGIDGEDLMVTPGLNDIYGGTVTAYRYFKFVTSATSSKFPVSKIYFGAFFDMGTNPDYYDPQILTEQDADTWRYPRGHIIMSKAYYPRHRFSVEWDAVTDAKAKSFQETILANPYRNHVFVYTTGYHDPLYDYRLVHCRVVADECSISRQATNWNTVTAVFEQLVG